jgi:histidinol-phosphate/aromatic aminotransferase/cobyric acid decarboxylase-like protein
MNIHDYSEKKKVSLKQILDFTGGVNPLGPSNRAKHAIREQTRYVQYPPDEDLRYLRSYLCRKEQINEWDIVFGAGSTHLLQSLFQHLRPPRVLLLSPESESHVETAGMYGAEIVFFPLDKEKGFALDVEKFLTRFRDVDMAVISSPHIVTGTIIPGGDLLRIMGEADRYGKILVIDEAYREYPGTESLVRDAVGSGSTVFLRTFSHFYALSGVRLGYGIGAPDLIKSVHAARPARQVNSLAPRAALMSLKDGAYSERTLKFLDHEKEYLREKLARVKGIEIIDTPCNLMLLEMVAELEELKEAFLKRNILVDGFPVRDGRICLRLPIGRHKANAVFIRTLRRIKGEISNG